MSATSDPPSPAPEASKAPDADAALVQTPLTEADLPHWRRRLAIFLTGQTSSLLGSMLVQYAILWHLTLETRSGTVMAVYAVVGFLPQAVVSIFGGVWADRLDRKLLIIGADATIAASTLVLALVMLSGYRDLWLLYLVAAIRSAGAGIQTPAVSALLPQIVPTDKLMRVNGINTTIQSALMLVAPAVAAALYASASIEAIFFVDVVTALIGIGLLALVPVARLVRTDQTAGVRGYLADLVGGVRYVAGDRFVRWVLALWGIVFLLIVAPSFLTPLMIVRTFGEEVWKLTVNELAFSVGMVLGGIVIAAWGGLKNRIAMVVGTAALFGLFTVGLGLSTNLWVFFAFMFLIGLGVPFFSTPSMTALQERVAPDRQGRVFGFVGIVMAVAMPIGMAVLGPLADRYRIESLLVGAGVALLLVVAAAVGLPSGRRTMAQAQTDAPAPVSAAP
ncbi:MULTISPECIES: MFS transporter [unclassified Actinotalea]|uniref:MFS transporter n=1 Tax=unclassified Actinotalea TaxID=2638618 RepID=UPI0015F500B3|nr:MULTISPECIES: MFS transporter [unclassified Actinotalea]